MLASAYCPSINILFRHFALQNFIDFNHTYFFFDFAWFKNYFKNFLFQFQKREVYCLFKSSLSGLLHNSEVIRPTLR